MFTVIMVHLIFSFTIDFDLHKDTMHGAPRFNCTSSVIICTLTQVVSPRIALVSAPGIINIANLDGAKLEIRARVVVHYSDKVVADVQLLVAAGRIGHQIRGHSRGNMEDHLGDVIVEAVGKIPVSPRAVQPTQIYHIWRDLSQAQQGAKTTQEVQVTR